jgi:hypothetical protein
MPDGPQPARHPWSGMLGPRVHRSHAISDPAATTVTAQPSSGLCIGSSSRRRSLDRLSLRSGQRFMIGTPSDPDCCPRSMAFSLIPLTTAGGEVYWR